MVDRSRQAGTRKLTILADSPSPAPDQPERAPSWFRELELERELFEIEYDLEAALFGERQEPS